MNQIDKMLNNIMGQKKKTNNKVLNNFGLKQFGGRNDLDFDGVLNKKDCQPRNTMRQDSKWKHVPTPAEPKHKTAYSESEPIRFKDIFSKNVYGDDGYAEVRGKYLDQNIKDNQEWAKKNALEKQEKAKKYPNVFSTRGTIRGQKKAGQLLDLKKSSLGVDYGQGEIFDDPYVGWRTRQAGETLRSLQNATIQKQQEWANKNEVQKDIQRITKEDTDGDNVPNEYDCEPQNKDKQGWAHSRSSFGREKTGQIKMMAPDKF